MVYANTKFIDCHLQTDGFVQNRIYFTHLKTTLCLYLWHTLQNREVGKSICTIHKKKREQDIEGLVECEREIQGKCLKNQINVNGSYHNMLSTNRNHKSDKYVIDYQITTKHIFEFIERKRENSEK